MAAEEVATARGCGGSPRASGAALVAFTAVLLLVGVAVLLRLTAPTAGGAAGDGGARGRLGAAKEGLIGWSATAYPAPGKRVAPGRLPYPDRRRDGIYDGKGDCVTFGLNDSHLLGRFPWAGDARPCPAMGLHVDIHAGAGEALWYAVSRNLVAGGAAAPVNSELRAPGVAGHPWITLRGADGRVLADPATGAALPVAAVVIAPGPALAGQDRGAPAPRPADFLDSVRIGGVAYSNADADGCADAAAAPCPASGAGEEFVSYREGPGFNDRLLPVTVDELMRAVEARVLGEAAMALERYRAAHGAYPWLAELRDAASMTFKSRLSRGGLLPVHLRDEIFQTGFGGSWAFVDATPTTVTRHSGDAALVPPLADVMSGSIRVAGDAGRCRWHDWTRADCSGTRTIPAYYRADLGKVVRRTVEYSFAVVDKAPRLTPPTPVDGRRRTLSVRSATLPTSPSVVTGVSVRDDDGINRGELGVLVDGDTGGAIVLSGIRYDLSIVYDGTHDERDELPEWFADNDWHRLVYVALSADAVAGGDADGDGDCTTPTDSCLKLKVAGRVARSDVRALVISAGAEITGQDRAIGDCNDDGLADDFLCAYLEGDNSDRSTPAAADTYARDPFGAAFNDQVRVVAPLPP